MTQKNAPLWNKDAAETFRAMLESPVGSAAFMHLAESRPPLLVGSDCNAAALAGAYAAGYELAIKNLIRLTETPPPVAGADQGSYPPPEDDTLWQDGQSLTEKPKESK
jgi:hypothetical protein